MCDFEEFIFTCGHTALTLKNYCHQSRNHPGHDCQNVKRLRNTWYQERVCNICQALINGTGPVDRGSNGRRLTDTRGPFTRDRGVEHFV